MSAAFLSSCRACGGTTLTPAFTVGRDNAWVYCGNADGDEGCGLVQRAVCGDERLVSGPTPPSWTEQYRLKSVVNGALEMVTTRKGKALDIGCGTGALLSNYPRWITPVGVDPRLSATGEADWGVAVAKPFLSEDARTILPKLAEGHFDIITAIGSFERCEAPTEFLDQVKSLLAPDGVFILETPYLALALTRTLTSPFHVDAAAVYSLATLETLVRGAGLRIVRGSMTEMSGGSIRLYMTHENYRGHDYGPWFEILARLWDEETALSLRGRQAFNAFSHRLRDRAMDIAAFKASMERADEHAYVLGTGPRTFAMLQAGDFDYDVIAAHIGSVPRDGFPEVITDDTARLAPPDVLIAPHWRRRETLEAWHDEVMAGMRIVFFEPELLVVDSETYPMELGRALAQTDGPGSVETLRAALSAMRTPTLQLVAQRQGA